MTDADESLSAQIAEFLAHIRAETGVPGIVAAVSLAGRRAMASIGTTSTGSGTRLTADARFHLGCVTKLLLALIALELDADGRLALQAPIGDYLTTLARSAVGRSVRVADLLSHTSGYLGTHVTDAATRALTWPWLEAMLVDAAVAFPPGRVFSYEHTESVLLGAVLRRVTGRGSDDLLRDRVLAPLGIVPDVLGGAATASAGRHIWDARRGRFASLPTSMAIPEFWIPAFSAFMLSVPELLVIGEALAGRGAGATLRPVAPNERHRLLGPAVDIPAAAGGPLRELLPGGFGLGAARFRDGFLGVNGLTEGQCLGLRFAPAGGLCVAVGINAMAPHLRDFALTALCRALGRNVIEQPPTRWTVALDECVGRYEGPGHRQVDVQALDGRLQCTLGRRDAAERLSVEVAIDEHGCPVLRSASPHLSLAFFRPPALEEVVLMVGLSAYKRIG